MVVDKILISFLLVEPLSWLRFAIGVMQWSCHFSQANLIFFYKSEITRNIFPFAILRFFFSRRRPFSELKNCSLMPKIVTASVVGCTRFGGTMPILSSRKQKYVSFFEHLRILAKYRPPVTIFVRRVSESDTTLYIGCEVWGSNCQLGWFRFLFGGKHM